MSKSKKTSADYERMVERELQEHRVVGMKKIAEAYGVQADPEDSEEWIKAWEKWQQDNYAWRPDYTHDMEDVRTTNMVWILNP
jgi:hypothetical protein